MKSVDATQWQRLLIAVGVSLGIALTLNWGILTLFGQKSADRAEHSLIGIIFLIAYVARYMGARETRLGAVTFLGLALIPCYVGTVFPDLDITFLGIRAHRNPLFHSSLSFLVLWRLVGRQGVILQIPVLGYGIGLASHLWWDTLFYGDVRWFPGGAMDRLWLAGNGLACLVPLLSHGDRIPLRKPS